VGEALRIIRHLVTFRRNGRKDREALQQLQLKAFRRMVRHAMDHTDFYARLYAGVDPDRVQPSDLPVVTKDDLLADPRGFLCDDRLRLPELREWVKDPACFGRYFLDRYVVFHTSGTSGPSTIVVYDRKAFELIKSVSLVRGRARPVSPRVALRALIEPSKKRYAAVVIDGGLYPAVTNFLYLPKTTGRFLDLRIFSLFTPLDELVRQLNDFRPKHLIGYPSVIATLAAEQLAGRLNLFDEDRDRSITTLSEPLHPHVRALARDAWGMPVIDTYGTGECLPLARGCGSHGRLHVNDDLALMEVVDENLEPVPPGVQGRHVLVSNLFNTAQPFLRYRVDDLVTLSPEPCPCGSALTPVESVQGRTEEMIWLESGEEHPELLHPYLFVVAMFRVPSVREYQVEQRPGRVLLVRVELADGRPGDLDRVKAEVDRELDRAGLRAPVQLEYEVVDRIGPDPATGKVRRVLPLA